MLTDHIPQTKELPCTQDVFIVKKRELFYLIQP